MTEVSGIQHSLKTEESESYNVTLLEARGRVMCSFLRLQKKNRMGSRETQILFLVVIALM